MDRHDFHGTVLREYDVRGVVGDTLGVADAYAIGRGFGTLAAARLGTRIAVGRDGRLSSPELESGVVEGLIAAGCDVQRIGLGPTPMLYFAVHHLDCHGGIMITGSHNPPDFNGFKMMIGHGPFYGDDILDLGRLASGGGWRAGAGVSADVDLSDAYVARLLRGYRGDAAPRVAWDCGNGASGAIVPRLIAGLPGQHRGLYTEVDGTFPNHHPDPTVEANLVDLKAAVAADGLDLGIGFDGDGDRIGVIDGAGRVLWGDQLLTILARDVLSRHPGAPVIADVKASQVLFDEIARAGGEPRMFKTGHSLIKAEMARIGAPIAGEMSGHIFIAEDFYGFDDALYVAVRFLDVLARDGRSAAEMRDSLPAMLNTPEVRFECPDEDKFRIVGEVKARLADLPDGSVNDIDGVRVTTEDGWWLLRASNTQPVLVARCESGTEAGLARLKAALVANLAPSGISPPPDF